MPKSGKERRAKRKTRQQVEAQLPDHWVPTSKTEERENNTLIRQAIRWNTDATQKDFQSHPSDLKAKDIALLITRRNMLSADPQISNAAVRNLISMEQQNQKDEQEPAKEETRTPGTVNNINVMNLSNETLLELKGLLHANT